MAGFDGVSVSRFAADLDRNLAQLADDVRSGRYRPQPLRTFRRRMAGRERVFGVAAVRDRVLQQAARAVLRPWLDDRQADSSFAYLRGRGWLDACAEVERHRDRGFVHVYRFDIKDYFESVDHDLLLDSVLDAIRTPEVAALILSWVTTPVVRGNVVRSSARGLALGTPISPALANHFLAGFDRAVPGDHCRLVRYADDGCVLCTSRERAETAEAVVHRVLAALGLEVNETKSGVTSFAEGFGFLGCVFRGRDVRTELGSSFVPARR